MIAQQGNDSERVIVLTQYVTDNVRHRATSSNYTKVQSFISYSILSWANNVPNVRKKQIIDSDDQNDNQTM